jgi:FMN phosphatase YigB (HAD superfamily)
VKLLLIIDLDGTVYRGDAPVRYYAELISGVLPAEQAPAYLAAVDRYLESGPAAASATEDTVEAAVLREAVDGWGAASGLAARCHAIPEYVTEAAFARARRWMATPACPIEVVEPLLLAVAELRSEAEACLVTNTGHEDLDRFLDRIGIDGCFDDVVAGADKPDGLRRLLRARLGPDLRQRPWRAFSVGDHYRNDIEPAAEIGAGCGYIDRYGRADGPATVTRPRAEDVLPALRAWVRDPEASARAGQGATERARTETLAWPIWNSGVASGSSGRARC